MAPDGYMLDTTEFNALVNGDVALPTETALRDISKWDEAKWTAEDELFDGMLTRLIELDGKDRGDNQRRDILIAETATKNGLILLSADRNLRMVTTEFGGRAMQPPR
jgi:hypothetical protein